MSSAGTGIGHAFGPRKCPTCRAAIQFQCFKRSPVWRWPLPRPTQAAANCTRITTKATATYGAAASTAAAAAVAVATPSFVAPIIAAACIYHTLAFGLMILLPRQREARRIIQSYWIFAPVAFAYLFLLAISWAPDTFSILLPGSLEAGLSTGKPQFFPQLHGIMTLFSRPITAASWLLHVLAINMFLGRSIYLSGLQQGVSTAHSLVLAFLFGPLGLVSHLFTKALVNVFPRQKQPDELPVVLSSMDGIITIMPYS